MFEVHRIRSIHILTWWFTAEWMEQCRCRIRPRAAAMDHERFRKIALQWLWRLMSPRWHLNLLFLHPLLMRSNWKTHTKPTPTSRWCPESVSPFSNKLSEKNWIELLIKKLLTSRQESETFTRRPLDIHRESYCLFAYYCSILGFVGLASSEKVE